VIYLRAYQRLAAAFQNFEFSSILCIFRRNFFFKDVIDLVLWAFLPYPILERKMPRLAQAKH